MRRCTDSGFIFICIFYSNSRICKVCIKLLDKLKNWRRCIVHSLLFLFGFDDRKGGIGMQKLYRWTLETGGSKGIRKTDVPRFPKAGSAFLHFVTISI